MTVGLSGRKEQTWSFLLLIILSPSFFLAVAPPTNLPEGTVITFPAQDDFNIETGMGSFCGSPSIVLDHFENYVKTNAPKNYIKYNPYKISVKGGGNYLYVYSAKACRRLSKYVSANIFVMARVHLVRYKVDKEHSLYDCHYDVEVKVFSTASGREKIVFSASDVPLDSLTDLLKGREFELWQSIIDITK